MGIRDQRSPRRDRWHGANIYPSQYATSKRYPTDRARLVGVPASEQEPRAIKCAQCGLPIEDYGKIRTCPFCSSDNFLGKLFE